MNPNNASGFDCACEGGFTGQTCAVAPQDPCIDYRSGESAPTGTHCIYDDATDQAGSCYAGVCHPNGQWLSPHMYSYYLSDPSTFAGNEAFDRCVGETDSTCTDGRTLTAQPSGQDGDDWQYMCYSRSGDGIGAPVTYTPYVPEGGGSEEVHCGPRPDLAEQTFDCNLLAEDTTINVRLDTNCTPTGLR